MKSPPDSPASATAHPFDAVRRHPVLSVLAVLALAIGVLVLLWDWNWLRGPIERQVKASTGREFDIAGNLDVDLGRITTVRMDAIRFGNAEWSKKPDMALSDRVEFKFEFWPALLRREFRIPDLRLSRPRLLLETGPRGIGNWVFGDEGGRPPRFEALWIDDGRLMYVDARTRSDVDIKVASRRPARGEATPTIALAGGGRWKGNPLTLEGTAESPLELRNTERPYRMDVRASSGRTHAHARGTLLDPLRMRDFDLKLALSGQNMDDLYPLIGVATPPTPPYELDGRLTRVINSPTSSTWKYDGFAGTVGDSDLAGYAHVTTGRRTLLKADLRSKRLDFDDLAGFVGAAPKSGGGEKSNPELQALAAKRAASPKLLPDTPYELEKMRAMDADVRWRAARITSPKLPLDDMDAHAYLKNGVLRLEPLNFGVAGGNIRSNIRMDARESTIRTRADIAARGLDLNKLMPDLKLARTAFGKLGGDVAITGSGNSIARMLANSDGTVAMGMGQGQISKLLMEYAGLDLAGILRIKLTGDKQIPIRCVHGDFAIKDGIMNTRRLVFDTTETLLVGSGSVSLREETLDLTIRPKTKRFSPLSLRSPLYMRGTLKQPAFRPDYARMGLRGAAAAALATVAAPAAALIATTDLGRERGDACAGSRYAK